MSASPESIIEIIGLSFEQDAIQVEGPWPDPHWSYVAPSGREFRWVEGKDNNWSVPGLKKQSGFLECEDCDVYCERERVGCTLSWLECPETGKEIWPEYRRETRWEATNSRVIGQFRAEVTPETKALLKTKRIKPKAIGLAPQFKAANGNITFHADAIVTDWTERDLPTGEEITGELVFTGDCPVTILSK